jgi:predicted TIM-barrel fold metal-dependent hydrolase
VAMEEARVDRIIQVTPSLMGYDNRYSLESAARYPNKIRVFCRLNPTSPEVAGDMEQCVADPHVAGLRLTIWPHQVELLTNGALAPFFKAAERLNLLVAVYAANQPTAIGDICRRYPELDLLVDHLTLRFSRRGTTFDLWRDVLRLAEIPNVYAKVSNLPMATAEKYPFPEAQQRLREVHEQFGAERMIWGSNYPVITNVCAYRESADFVREACDFMPVTDRQLILGGSLRKLLRRKRHP